MLADKALIHEPTYYSSIWSIIGIILIFIVGIVIFLIFFTTRKKEIKNLSTLKLKAREEIDYNYLREKYLKMVSLVVDRFESHKIKASSAHQDLSLIVRLFYAEANGFHAEVLTLNDLKKSREKELLDVIEHYYPDEFNMLEKGSVKDASEKARQLISNDNILKGNRR